MRQTGFEERMLGVRGVEQGVSGEGRVAKLREKIEGG
jgi:hypothetical protein